MFIERNPMRFSLLKTSIAVVAALAAALLIAACGGGGGGGEAQKGGTAKMLDTAGGVDSIDPGYWYYQSDYEELGNTTQRWLYGWKPDESKPTPDLATGPPKTSNGNKTITVTIKSGIKYSAPLQNRTVKTADIKYAMERCFLPQVGNGYANSYYADIVGVGAFKSGKAKDISGIQTPNDTTLGSPLPSRLASSPSRTAARSACPARPRSRRTTPRSTTRAKPRPTASTRSSPGRT